MNMPEGSATNAGGGAFLADRDMNRICSDFHNPIGFRDCSVEFEKSKSYFAGRFVCWELLNFQECVILHNEGLLP